MLSDAWRLRRPLQGCRRRWTLAAVQTCSNKSKSRLWSMKFRFWNSLFVGERRRRRRRGHQHNQPARQKARRISSGNGSAYIAARLHGARSCKSSSGCCSYSQQIMTGPGAMTLQGGAEARGVIKRARKYGNPSGRNKMDTVTMVRKC
jgi:hypothetical protein